MVSVILVRPQMGENIGAAARAMQNFNLTDLRLVAPRDGWPNERAHTMSAGALDQMPPVQVFDTLESATSDLHYCFATTARTRDMVKPSFTPEGAAIEGHKRQSNGQGIGILFGAERTGLLNEEIAHAQSIISIPTNPDFSSLNLGQSVLLLAYEWMKHTDLSASTQNLNMGDSFPASQGEVQNFISRLDKDLEDKNFYRSDDLKPTMQKNIQNIFTRADITDQELRTLHGILSALRGNKSQK